MRRHYHDLWGILWDSLIFWDIQTFIQYWDFLVILLKGSIRPFGEQKYNKFWSKMHYTLKVFFNIAVIEKTLLFKSNETRFKSIYYQATEKIIR